MNDEFTLTVEYKGEPKDYQARLVQFGYSYRIVVSIHDVEVYFEPDEERNLRVVTMLDQDERSLGKIDKNLLAIIKQKIEEIIS